MWERSERLLNFVPMLPVIWLCERSIHLIAVRLVNDGMLLVSRLLFKRRYLSLAKLLNCVEMLPVSQLFEKSAHLSFVRRVRAGMLPDK